MQIKQGFQENYHITQFLPIKIKIKNNYHITQFLKVTKEPSSNNFCRLVKNSSIKNKDSRHVFEDFA